MTSSSVYFCSTRIAGTKQVMDYYAWMGLTLLTERHADQIAGVLSCYDRILIFGTLPNICFAEGMTCFCYAYRERFFGHPRFAKPFGDDLGLTRDGLAPWRAFACRLS